MDLYWNNKLICEVEVYADKNLHQRPEEDLWHIEIYGYFNAQNLLELYESEFIGASYFREDMGSIQKYRLNYNEGCDIDFPKPRSYSLSDPQFNEDKGKIIDVIRKRLQNLAKNYDLQYTED